jgi:hypothetical protein
MFIIDFVAADYSKADNAFKEPLDSFYYNELVIDFLDLSNYLHVCLPLSYYLRIILGELSTAQLFSLVSGFL